MNIIIIYISDFSINTIYKPSITNQLQLFFCENKKS